MIEQLAAPLASAATVLLVVVYSAWRARRESTVLVTSAIAEGEAHFVGLLEQLRATAASPEVVEADPQCAVEAGRRGETSEPAIGPIREAFGTLVRDDDLALLRQTLGSGQAVEDAGRALGLTPDQARTRFAEALRRLCAFAEVAEAQGFAKNGSPA